MNQLALPDLRPLNLRLEAFRLSSAAAAGFVRAGAMAALLAAAGCQSVGPDYTPPAAVTADSWLAGSPVSASSAEAQWWKVFKDPILDGLIEQAASGNLNLKIAGLRVIEARALRGIAAGQFFPQVQSLQGTVGDRQLSVNSPAAIGDRSYADADIRLQAAWEMDFWGKFRRNLEATDAQMQAAVGDYDSVMVALIGDVATNYVIIRSLQERVAIAEANGSLQEATLELTNLRFKAGKVSELDVTTARATLANTQARVPDLRNSLRSAKLALALLLGKRPEAFEELFNTNAFTPEAPTSIAAGVPADLLRRRPDIRAAERAIAVASARIGVATADLYPSISITGNTGFAAASLDNARNSKMSDIFSADSFTGFIGLSINWPIFNYGRIENNIRASDARFEQALANYQQRVLTAASEVESNLYALLQREKQAASLTESVNAARRSEELAQIQYRNGAADFIRLNDAQSTLFERQETLVATKALAALAAINTYRALGGGWEIRGGSEFVDQDTAERMKARTNWGDVLRSDYTSGKDMFIARPGDMRPVDAKREPIVAAPAAGTQASPNQ